MHQQHRLKASVALVTSLAAFACLPAGAALAKAPAVSLRVEGLNKTLIAARRVQTKSGDVTRDGHKVVGTTALGALNTATGGHWTGTWDTEYSEWELTGILGEKHLFNSKYFWAVYVDHVQASSGAGEVELKTGESLVFAALPDSDYDEDLLGASAPSTATRGQRIAVKVFYYNASGRRHALAGATVALNGHTTKTGSSGVAHLTIGTTGSKTLKISKHGYVRTESTLRVAA